MPYAVADLVVHVLPPPSTAGAGANGLARDPRMCDAYTGCGPLSEAGCQPPSAPPGPMLCGAFTGCGPASGAQSDECLPAATAPLDLHALRSELRARRGGLTAAVR
jgi:hypothetical protein